MNKYYKETSNYDKYPVVEVSEMSQECWNGWEAITNRLKEDLSKIRKNKKIVVIECYQGVLDKEVINALQTNFPAAEWFYSKEAMLSSDVISEKLKEDITDDEIFGYMTRCNIDCYFDADKVREMRESISIAKEELIFIYGVGAAYIQSEYDRLVYADLARWEIQMRFRRNEVSNIGIENKEERASLQYKRGFFVDWRICDRFKKTLMKKWDYVLDTNITGNPKMATGTAIWTGLEKASQTPFRVVPFFDLGPWGGQWMKEVCNLDRKSANYAWCFDCVPEENSLYLGFGNIRFEIPSINLVFAYPAQLLGNPVYGRFGDEFPIRFDFLDTMEGGNLSLQVHPLTQYVQQKFGMHYTHYVKSTVMESK